LVAGVADHCSYAATALVQYPPETRYLDMRLTIDDFSIARLGLGGCWRIF
jgi:hypothetical protein